MMTPPIKSEIPGVVKSISRYVRRISGVESIFAAARRLVTVGTVSSAARMPFPSATSACAVLPKSAVVIAFDFLARLMLRDQPSRGATRSSRRGYLDSFHRDGSIPPLDRGPATVVAEDTQRRGVEKEVTPCCGWKPDPSRCEDPEDVTMSKERNVLSDGAHAFNNRVNPSSDVLRALPTRAAVREDHPARRRCADLLRCQALIVAIVPFDEIVIDFGPLAETGQHAGLAGTGEGACKNSRKCHLRQNRRQSFG